MDFINFEIPQRKWEAGIRGQVIGDTIRRIQGYLDENYTDEYPATLAFQVQGKGAADHEDFVSTFRIYLNEDRMISDIGTEPGFAEAVTPYTEIDEYEFHNNIVSVVFMTEGRPHRVGGPALINFPKQAVSWYVHGVHCKTAESFRQAISLLPDEEDRESGMVALLRCGEMFVDA